MSANTTIELRVRRDGAKTELLSPGVGLFTESRGAGNVLVAGETAGALLVLGRAVRLVVPEGVSGRVANAAKDRVHAPVGYGDVLYELEPISAADATGANDAKEAGARAGALVLRSPQSGRFYHRPAPGEPAFANAGSVVADGQPVGLIEVMKTFTHVVYRASATLPAHATLARYVAVDGGEVRAGDALIEFERA
ncbi:MAG: hypothetical protein IPJ77_07830 [Planctomycetes bacterium]|nr:hypothetical protein [Planctomycetota bacterium]